MEGLSEIFGPNHSNIYYILYELILQPNLNYLYSIFLCPPGDSSKCTAQGALNKEKKSDCRSHWPMVITMLEQAQFCLPGCSATK